MRIFYFLLLAIFLGAVGLFAIQNREPVMVEFLDQQVAAPLSLWAAALYLLGMLSGWTVVGLVKRSWQSVTARSQAS